MNLYDPVLGGYLSPATSPTHGLALASIAFSREVNAALATDRSREVITALATDDTKGCFLTADVADAFDTYDSADMVTWEGQQLPINVARVCSWTWICQTPPSGPNIHANKNGYQVIANAFASVIGKRVHQ